mgnify:CR=1 FL=1
MTTDLRPDIRLVAAHPNWAESRVNRRLAEAARALPRVELLDLYGRYPDYAIDVPREQAALADKRLLVLLHPVHWYALPALAKLWIDEVFSHGWAYGHDGTALQGKDFWLVASTGGPAESYRPEGYNRFGFEAFLPPLVQTANLCGMRFLPPQVIHGAHRLDEAALEAEVARFTARLATYPDWPDIDACRDGCWADVPAADR